MTEERLEQALREMGKAEQEDPDCQALDEAGPLIERIEQGEKLPPDEGRRLLELAIQSYIVRDELFERLRKRSKS